MLEKVSDLVNKLPRGYRERAFRRIDQEKLSQGRSSISMMILIDIDWSDKNTPECFWAQLYDFYEKKEGVKMPPLPRNDYTRT